MSLFLIPSFFNSSRILHKLLLILTPPLYTFSCTLSISIFIIFDFDDPKNSAEVDSFKLNSRGNILISNYKEDLLPIDEDEMAIRCLREDKGYSRRYK